MSGDEILLIWLTIVRVIGLNGCAAGAAALLHLWRRRVRRASKAVSAALLSGLLPASIFLPMGFTDRGFIFGEGPIVIGIAFATLLIVSGLISLPGALLVVRKLDVAGDDYRAFE